MLWFRTLTDALGCASSTGGPMTKTNVGVAIVLVVISGLSSFAQVGGVKTTDSALQAAIEGRQNAISTRNAADWEKYTATQFVNVSENGEILSRESRLKTQTSSPATNSKAVIDSIRIFGPDTAVSIQHNTPNNNRITIVWVRQAGAWKAVSSHISSIKGK
jgi:hypothetical protein